MLYDKLKKYYDSGIYPFHMPGHKRNSVNGLNEIPYSLDITEIDGFDNLHCAEGCLQGIENKAARLYGVKRAYMLVNGATCGILASIRALTRFGDKVLVARNCHKSVYNAIELCGLDPIYVLPEVNKKYGIYSSISCDKVGNLLNENPDIKLVILTSPTYEGVVSNIKSISKVCHKHNAKLFVDEAHGAHFPFSSDFPEEAVNCGANAAVVSLHKTLPSLTQTALLLTNDLSLENILSENLSVFETSSPSYVLMSSIDNCMKFLENSNSQFTDYIFKLKEFYSSVCVLKNISVLNCCDKTINSFYDYDIGKIIISVKYTNINGKQLAKILRDKYKIETEMAYSDYVIAMTSVLDSSFGFERLSDALKSIDADCIHSDENSFEFKAVAQLPKKKFPACRKFDYKLKTVSLDNSVGKISLEYILAYPPGIPLVVPGEVLSDNIIKNIKHLIENGVDVFSSEKNLPNGISVSDL